MNKQEKEALAQAYLLVEAAYDRAVNTDIRTADYLDNALMALLNFDIYREVEEAREDYLATMDKHNK